MYDIHCDICFSSGTSVDLVFEFPVSEIETEELALFSNKCFLELALDALVLLLSLPLTRLMLRWRFVVEYAPLGEEEMADEVAFETELDLAGRRALPLLPNFIWKTVLKTKYMITVLMMITSVAGTMSANIWYGWRDEVIQQLSGI